MGIVLDLVILAILILNIIIGYKKGLMNVIINICAFLIAIVASLILYKPISMIIINNTSIDDTIKETIINNTIKTNENNKEETSLIDKYVTGKIEEQTNEAKKQAIEIVANSISIKAVEILTGIILFIAIRIIIVVLKLLTNIISKIPIIEQFNEVGGVIYGIIKAIIIIYILLTILFFIVSINGHGIIQNAIDNSYITKYLFENNIIINYCLLGKNLL